VGYGLRLGVGFVVDKVLLGFENLGTSKRGVAPTFDFDALAFEILVNGEEVGDLTEHVRVDFGEVPDIFVAWVPLADAEDLLVAEALIEHLKYADGTNLHDASGKAGSVDEDETVERVTVVGESAGDETIVAGIVDGGIEVAVEAEDMEFFVVLVFVDALVRDFDDGVNDLGAVRPDREFQVIRHKGRVSSLFFCSSLLWMKNLRFADVMIAVAAQVPWWGHVVTLGTKAAPCL